jgi:formylglycine-generating enzyme required for sulfatase activity
MWEAKAGSSDISWEEARTYCENLQLGGYSDWRLPTREELKTLHETKAACGWHEPTPVRGAMTVWTSERTDSSARVYNLCTGQDRESQNLTNGSMAGALAVRNK